MITSVSSKVIKHVSYIETVVQGVGLAMDVKEIIETSTPI